MELSERRVWRASTSKEHDGCKRDSDGSTEDHAPDQVENDLRDELRNIAADVIKGAGR
jgi:hypothetical protein